MAFGGRRKDWLERGQGGVEGVSVSWQRRGKERKSAQILKQEIQRYLSPIPPTCPETWPSQTTSGAQATFIQTYTFNSVFTLAP